MPYHGGHGSNQTCGGCHGWRCQLAAAIGVAGPTVSQWIKACAKVPVERCMQIEQHTGVPCEQLRPDVAWHVLRGPSTTQRPHDTAPRLCCGHPNPSACSCQGSPRCACSLLSTAWPGCPTNGWPGFFGRRRRPIQRRTARGLRPETLPTSHHAAPRGCSQRGCTATGPGRVVAGTPVAGPARACQRGAPGDAEAAQRRRP